MGWAIPGATEFLGQLGKARNTRGVTGHDEVKRNQTLKALVRKDTTKPVIHLLLHWIDKTCFKLWRAVAERGRWSSAAPGQQPPLPLWNPGQHRSALTPCVTPFVTAQKRLVAAPQASSWLSPLLQPVVTGWAAAGTLTVWSVRGGSTICFSILFKTNFHSSFKSRFRTVFSQIFAETLKLE